MKFNFFVFNIEALGAYRSESKPHVFEMGLAYCESKNGVVMKRTKIVSSVKVEKQNIDARALVFYKKHRNNIDFFRDLKPIGGEKGDTIKKAVEKMNIFYLKHNPSSEPVPIAMQHMKSDKRMMHLIKKYYGIKFVWNIADGEDINKYMQVSKSLNKKVVFDDERDFITLNELNLDSKNFAAASQVILESHASFVTDDGIIKNLDIKDLL